MSLYSMRLFDSGDDGWQGATWTIYNEAQQLVLPGLIGTLVDGQSERTFHCVPDACGWLVVGGGAADSEISWELDSHVGASFRGAAPTTDYRACAAPPSFFLEFAHCLFTSPRLLAQSAS